MTLPVAILAGGLATRLRPVTAAIPKSLVEVAGEPFACHQMRLLAKNGIERVVFCIGYLGKQIIDVLKDGSAFDLKVEYVFDCPVLLGTAGALKRALPQLGHEFFVLYGDSYLDCDYRGVEATYRASRKQALMTIYQNNGKFDSSNVEFDGIKIVRYDKDARSTSMNYIDYGLGVLSAVCLDDIPVDVATDLAIIYKGLAEEERLASYEVAKRFYEVGSFAGIAELEAHLGSGS